MVLGYVKLHRALLDSSVFHNEKKLKIFIWCLLKATHTKRNQVVGRQSIDLREGEFIFGRNQSSLELNMTPSTLWNYMKDLEKDKTIQIKSNNKFSVVSITNWDFYQNTQGDNDNTSNNKFTTKKQEIDTNKNVKNVENNKYRAQFDDL